MRSQITSFEAACAANGISPNLPDVSMLPEAQGKYIIGVIKMDAITKALNNEGQDKEWIPNYNDLSERKYFAHYARSAGGVWSYEDCDLWNTLSIAGARPFREYSDMIFASENFGDILNDILNYTNS